MGRDSRELADKLKTCNRVIFNTKFNNWKHDKLCENLSGLVNTSFYCIFM